jgi:hypothetical protein
MKEVTFKVLDFMFPSSELAEEFSNRIKTMVLCTVVRSLPGMVSVKIEDI